MKLAEATLDALMLQRPPPAQQSPQRLCLDKGYDFEEVCALATDLGFTLHLRRRGEEPRKMRDQGRRARRWVVERTHSWLNRFRGLLVRWTKKADNYLALVHLACGIITWRATGLLG